MEGNLVKEDAQMKNIFNPVFMQEILERIDELSPESRGQWGKMDVAQMLAHCSAFQDIAMGDSFPKRGWLGIVVGRLPNQFFIMINR